MDQGLTPAAAKELGRAFRKARNTREWSMREAAKACGVSVQYILNIETGTRTNVSEEILHKIGDGYRIGSNAMANHLFRARTVSALERRGLNQAQQTVAWKRLEAALVELGFDMKASVADIVDEWYTGGGESTG